MSDLIYRLRERARIRRQISTRKSVQNNEPDRISDLLEEAANEIESLNMYNFTDRTSGSYTQLRSDDGTWYRVFDDGGILGLDEYSDVHDDTKIIERKLGYNKQFFTALRKKAKANVVQKESTTAYSHELHNSPSIDICEIATNSHPECVLQYQTTEQLFGFERTKAPQIATSTHNITINAEHINLALNDVTCEMVLLSGETIAHGFAKICNRAIEIAQSERVSGVESDGNYF